MIINGAVHTNGATHEKRKPVPSINIQILQAGPSPIKMAIEPKYTPNEIINKKAPQKFPKAIKYGYRMVPNAL